MTAPAKSTPTNNRTSGELESAHAPSNLPSSRIHLTILVILILAVFMSSCYRQECSIEPNIQYTPQRCEISRLPAAFAELNPKERAQEWGKEYFVGRLFAKEMDFYRAITCFKKALFLLPKKEYERRFEIEYEIFLSYYIAGKYQDAIEAFECSHLMDVSDTFPCLTDLRVLLYDCYMRMDQQERACAVLQTLQLADDTKARSLYLATEIESANIEAILEAAQGTCAQAGVDRMLMLYEIGSKSVTTAKTLNAILPGAGYYYVGQKKSALTSFLINALFIAASYQLFDRGYIPAGIIVASLECGWYFGGINGAGIEAHQYNQCLYERLGRETMAQERLFPILMIENSF